MIVPTNRLLLMTLLGVLPGAALAGTTGPLAGLGWGLLALGFLLAVLDALLSRRRLVGVQLTLPNVVHAIHGSQFEVVARVADTGGLSALKVEFDAPWQLESHYDGRPHRLVAGRTGAAADIALLFSARERGRFLLARAHLETGSRLGLWGVREMRETAVAVHSYPSLRQDRRALASSALMSSLVGAILSLKTGHGRSFDRLRDYVPGDDLDDVHWRATAKRHRPVTKLFEVERSQNVYVAIDTSRLSGRVWDSHATSDGGEPTLLTLLERYINATLLLGAVASRQGDRFGLLSFSDRVDAFVAAQNTAGNYRACREAVLGLETRRVNADYRELFRFLGERVRRRSLIFVLTSLDDPALSEELVQSVALASRRHLVVIGAVTPVDARPLDKPLPVVHADEIAERLAGHLAHDRLRAQTRRLHQIGVGFLPLENARMVLRLVQHYVEIKRKEAL